VKAAVLHTLGQPPRCEDLADPQAIEGEVLVRVKAASLKSVDKMMASGSHYDRLPDLPCVCGVDGVGLLDDGTRVFLAATGVAGQLAVQIAKHLGAERVVAAGRNRRVLTTLCDLGADATIALDLSDRELTAAFIREAANSASRPNRFHSPRLKALGNGEILMAAGWSLSRDKPIGP
jgi:NADPH:quinone reductase-like Zn-dependent oxidoreductase